MKLHWQTIADSLCFIVILRFLLAWLLASKRLLRMALTLMGIGLFISAVSFFEFPLTRILTTALAVPMILLLLLSYLPEIRRAYEDARLFSFLGNQRKTSNQLISHLAPALLEMSQKRVGGIFVFPGRMDLEAHISGGEPYDARLTHSLVLSLFNTHAPRHDGAAIVQGDRITHVGAVLPLSASENPRDEWGTRHLAGLGLSEKCDADILIISEERGTISHASEGIIEELPVSTQEALEKKLAQLLHQESGSPGVLSKKKLSLALWFLSILAALLALPTLKYLEKTKTLEIEKNKTIMVLDVPVSFSNVPENLYVERIEASSVRIYARVPFDQASMPATGLNVVIDLQGYSPSNSTVILGNDMLKGAPLGWEVTRYEPEGLELQLHEARIMDLKPEAVFSGLPSNLQVASVTFTPVSLHVLVKDSLIEATKLLQTTPVNLSAIEEPGSYSFNTKVELPASIRLVNKNDTLLVQIRVEITAKRSFKSKR
jgi:diadenylate cyclase